MLRTMRICLLSLIALGLCALDGARAQTAPTPPATPSAGPAAGRGPTIPGANDVLATVTINDHSDKVTKGELVNFISRYPIPPSEDRDQVYHEAVDSLINTKLLTHYISRQKVPVTPAMVDAQIENLKQKLKADGQDLATALLQSNVSMDDVRKEYENRVRWSEFVKSRATDAALRKYVADNRDLFSGTQVRASHILLKVEPNASQADKEKVKQKLLGIKGEIEQGKITFAEAANKYSEDPANTGGAGGDLDYFTLNSGLVEEFANAAFKLKKAAISNPVETPFGFHLIQVTDRREGKPIDFEQNKLMIQQAYATELQKDVLTAERKTAKIDVKPMPKDLFPPEASVNAGGAAGTAGGATPSAATSSTPKP